MSVFIIKKIETKKYIKFDAFGFRRECTAKLRIYKM